MQKSKVGRKCSICHHPRRVEIDQDLIEGASVASISREYAVSVDTIFRHKKKHLVGSICSTAPETAVAELAVPTWNIPEILRNRLEDAERLGKLAEQGQNIAVALDAIRTWIAVFKLQAQLMGELGGDITVNNVQINNTVVISGFCRELLEILRPYPEARMAVSDFMASLGAR